MGTMLSRGLVGVAVLNEECLICICCYWWMMMMLYKMMAPIHNPHTNFSLFISQSVSDDTLCPSRSFFVGNYETNDVCVSVCPLVLPSSVQHL